MRYDFFLWCASEIRIAQHMLQSGLMLVVCPLFSDVFILYQNVHMTSSIYPVRQLCAYVYTLRTSSFSSRWDFFFCAYFSDTLWWNDLCVNNSHDDNPFRMKSIILKFEIVLHKWNPINVRFIDKTINATTRHVTLITFRQCRI